MTDIMYWAVGNSIGRFVLTLVVSFELIAYGDLLNRLERIGLGIMGGSAFLTIAPILDIYKQGTPFDKWSTLLLSLGVVLYIIGRCSRHARHRLRNQRAADLAEQHMNRRISDRK